MMHWEHHIYGAIFYGCENWSALRVFDNRVLGEIFSLEWDKVTGE